MACLVCKGVLKEPVSTPCGHHFCKPCLEKKFAVRASSAGLLAHAAAAKHITNTGFWRKMARERPRNTSRWTCFHEQPGNTLRWTCCHERVGRTRLHMHKPSHRCVAAGPGRPGQTTTDWHGQRCLEHEHRGARLRADRFLLPCMTAASGEGGRSHTRLPPEASGCFCAHTIWRQGPG